MRTFKEEFNKTDFDLTAMGFFKIIYNRLIIKVFLYLFFTLTSLSLTLLCIFVFHNLVSFYVLLVLFIFLFWFFIYRSFNLIRISKIIKMIKNKRIKSELRIMKPFYYYAKISFNRRMIHWHYLAYKQSFNKYNSKNYAGPEWVRKESLEWDWDGIWAVPNASYYSGELIFYLIFYPIIIPIIFVVLFLFISPWLLDLFSQKYNFFKVKTNSIVEGNIIKMIFNLNLLFLADDENI